MDVGLPQPPSIRLRGIKPNLLWYQPRTNLEGIDVVGEYNDFIPSILVEPDEKLACLEFVGVHAIE